MYPIINQYSSAYIHLSISAYLSVYLYSLDILPSMDKTSLVASLQLSVPWDSLIFYFVTLLWSSSFYKSHSILSVIPQCPCSYCILLLQKKFLTYLLFEHFFFNILILIHGFSVGPYFHLTFRFYFNPYNTDKFYFMAFYTNEQKKPIRTTFGICVSGVSFLDSTTLAFPNWKVILKSVEAVNGEWIHPCEPIERAALMECDAGNDKLTSDRW